MRTIALLTDPSLLRRGPADRGAARRGRGLPAARPIDPALRERAQPQHARATSCRRSAAEHPGLSGREPQQRVERLMSDYFRHARIGQPVARVGAQDRAGAGRAEPRCNRATASASSTRAQAARKPATWLGAVSGGDRRTAPRLRRGAGAASSSTSSAIRAEDFFPTPSDRAALLRLSEAAAPGSTRGCRRCTTAGCSGAMFPEFQAISCRVVRDFYHKYTVDEHTLLTIRNLERLTDAVDADRGAVRVAARRLDAPELLVLALLYHDVGKWRDDDHAIESVRMAQADARAAAAAPEDARDRRVPDPPAPADVAGGVPPRHRGSGDRHASSRRSSAPKSG